MQRRVWLRPLPWLLASVLPGCTDVSLCKMPCEPAPEVRDDRVALKGRACTLDPTTVVFPYKVLFVIDVSGSNRTSDPQGNRAGAVDAAVQQLSSNPAVSFGILSFNMQAQPVTNGFDTMSRLPPASMSMLKTAEGGTNYLDTLKLAYEFIEEDILSLTEGQRARARYDIQWLSDGRPDPCQSPEAVRAGTEKILALENKYNLFSLRINTLRLHYDGSGEEACQGATVDDFLGSMAELGSGEYRVLSSAELDFKIAVTEIRRRMSRTHFFVTNESRVVVDNGLWPDSDSDGIRDLDEKDPSSLASPDANGDGCSDAVDRALLPNEGLCGSLCAGEEMLDSDRDGLPDCAERALGYQRMSGDSDRDGFGDGLELRFGTDPLAARTLTEDTDLDGVNDADEIRRGTNPRSPEQDPELAFRYGPLTPAGEGAPGTTCFEFLVENVRLVQTEATPTSQRGENRLCLYLAQTPSDDPDAEPLLTRTCKTARLVQAGGGLLKEPADGIITITAEDFSPQR